MMVGNLSIIIHFVLFVLSQIQIYLKYNVRKMLIFFQVAMVIGWKSSMAWDRKLLRQKNSLSVLSKQRLFIK